MTLNCNDGEQLVEDVRSAGLWLELRVVNQALFAELFFFFVKIILN
jgi:hypothetical protein